LVAAGTVERALLYLGALCWTLGRDTELLVFRVPPLVVPDAVDPEVDCAGLLTVELAGALVVAGAVEELGAGDVEAAGADASVGLGLGFDGGGAVGEEGVPKPGEVHAQARLTPTTATDRADKTAMVITRVRLDIRSTPLKSCSKSTPI